MLAGVGKVVANLELAVVSSRDGALLLLKTYQAEVPSAAGPEAEAAALTQASGDIITAFIADLGRVAKP
jgi:hypothetical protein